MNSLPLSYPSLKCVIEHLEANLRIQLAHCIPSIRIAEKSTPLRIDYLHLQSLTFKINKSEYKPGIICTSENEELLKRFQEDNKRGGVQYDLDEFGVPDWSYEFVVMPGDVVIERENRVDRNQVRLEVLEPQLRRLMIRRGFERNEENAQPVNDEVVAVPAAQNQNQNNEDDHVPQAGVVALDVQNDQQEIEFKRDIEIIKNYQDAILPLRLREDNAQSPYTNYFQLTVTTPDERKIERLVYNKKIHEAAKYILWKIFGKRKHNVYVKRFHVDPEGGIFRLPEGLKLIIDELKIGRSVKRFMNGLESLLDESSFPLKTFEMTSDWNQRYPEDYIHQIVKTAERLNISDRADYNTWINMFLGFSNREVNWIRGAFSVEEFITFLKNRLETVRDIGTNVSFGIGRKEFAEEILPLIKALPNAKLATLEGTGCSMFPQCITFPMSDCSELNIYGVEDSEQNEHPYKSLWILKMKIMKLGSATPLDD